MNLPDLPPPAPPADATFDSSRNAWILSRYADVLLAFREHRLIPIGSGREESVAQSAEALLKLRAETFAALSPAALAGWREQLTAMANRMVDELPLRRPVDLIGEFLEPWCAAMAVMVTGADPADGVRLVELARRADARAELERALPNSAMGEPVFMALSQTLPCFLGRAWLALLRDPRQLLRLQARSDLMPGAIEELLRYAGVAQKLYRRALEDVSLGSFAMAAGQDAILMVASANRDPEQFSDPNRLDIERRPAGQLGLGAAVHSCAGAALIRMGATIATAALIGRLDAETVRPSVQWRGAGSIACASELQVVMAASSMGR